MPTDKEIQKKIDEFIIGMMKDRGTPGITLGIIKDDQVFYSRGYGYRNIHEELPMTPDTLYGIGSSSKSFIALAMMILVEEGKIDLEAPVSDYIDFQLGLENHPIKVKHILSHASGVQDLTFGILPFMWAEHNYKRVLPMSNPDDYLTVLNTVKSFVKFKPDEQFMYNNDLYEVAGLVIQSQIKGTYEDFVADRIMNPLGMERSTYSKTQFFDDRLKDIMTGYGMDPQTNKITERKFPFGKTLNACGAILASANEMLKYLQMYLNKGTYKGKKLISQESIEKMWTPRIKCSYGLKDPEYCMGWIREAFLGTTLMHHGGNIAASSNAMQLLPEKKIGVSLGQNMDNDLTDTLGRGVLAIMLGKEPAIVLPKLTIMKKLAPILGAYTDHAGASNVLVEFAEPVLMITAKRVDFPEMKFPIIPIDMDELTFKVASPLPILLEIKFFIDNETKAVFVKIDRSLFFKK